MIGRAPPMLSSPLLGLLSVFLAVAPGANDEVLGLREVDRAFRFTKRPERRLEERRTALDGLRGDSGDVAQALILAASALEDEALELERDRRDWLGDARADEDLQLRRVLDPLRELQDRVRTRLLALGSVGAARTMFAYALEDAKVPFTLRMELAPFARAIDDKTFARVVKALKSRHEDEVCVALRAVAHRAVVPDDVVPSVVSLLGHDSAVVRELAAETLSVLARPGCVGPLVAALASESGRTRLRFGRALEILTGASLPDSPSMWADWWADHRDEVLAGEVELGAGEPVERAGDETRYHDIPIDGESVMFVIDRSLSMRELLSGTILLPDGKKVLDRRFLRATRELVRTLQALPSGTRFNVVAFGTGAVAFEDEMREADPATVADAVEWVVAQCSALEPGTAMYDGLDLAFALGGRPARDGYHELTFDTMFVLTDGEPTKGVFRRSIVFDSTDAILAATRRWNLLGRVVIHTIALGDETGEELMRGLAGENGGRFVQEE
jgi:hypothetical protein